MSRTPWAWVRVLCGLGVGLPLPVAVAACYRSQFLDTTLPGGVVGDVHRAWRHGQYAGDLSRGVRAVAWERLAGHVVLTSPARLLPLAVLVILAMGVPTSVAGWGPREGMAAWAFGAAGLGAAHGVATAVVYGVMSFVASLPGAVVLLVAWWLRRHGRDPRPVSARGWEPADSTEGTVHV